MGRPPGPHIVLGVDFEESDWLRRGNDVAKMRWLEADAGTRRKVCNNGHSFRFPSRATWQRHSECRMEPVALPGQDLLGSSVPVPAGVLIVAQVPFGTYFQALPR